MIRSVLALCTLALCSSLAGAADDTIKKNLDSARATFEAEAQKVRQAVGEWLDKREEAARKDGNKRLVEQIKVEQEAFQDAGELPRNLPVPLKQRLVAARTSMEAAYATAMKAYTREKKDDEAAAVETELAEFKREFRPSLPARGSGSTQAARDRLAAALPKIVWAPGRGGWGREFVFAADGHVYSPPSTRSPSTWAVIGPNTLVTMNQDGSVDVFAVDLARGTAKVRCVGTMLRPSATWDATAHGR